MWTWSLNWGEITPHIVVGTCPMTPDHIRRIGAEARVTAMLSLQHDECLAYWGIDYPAMCHTAKERGLAVRRCPIRDFDVADMRKNLPLAVSTLAHLLNAGHRTYIHCTAGLGRAPLTVLGYLVWIKEYSAEHANKRILNGRPGAIPAWEALTGACRDLERRHRNEIEKRAYHLFQADVYQDALTDWNHAKSEIVKAALMSGGRETLEAEDHLEGSKLVSVDRGPTIPGD